MSAPTYWRLDAITDAEGNAAENEGWSVGGIYQHLNRVDGLPPNYSNFDEYSGDFLRLHWTEVPDPRISGAGDSDRHPSPAPATSH